MADDLLQEIVDQLRMGGYTCEAGRLEDDIAFRWLELMASALPEDLRERLAAYAHDAAWSGWMKYLRSKSTVNEDGSWTVPAEYAARWDRQMQTPYADLSEGEKESDRREADRMIAIMVAYATGTAVDALDPVEVAGEPVPAWVLNGRVVVDRDRVVAAVRRAQPVEEA